jgi:microcystin-dependent protein
MSVPFAVMSQQIANGAVGSNQLSIGSVSSNHLTQQVMDLLAPPGSINAFMGTNPPPGWLLCDGAVVGRTNYTRLFAVIGTSSGLGDGISTFHLPDLRGMFLRGFNGSRSGTNFWDPDAALRTNVITGANSGNAIGSVQFDELKSHFHLVQHPQTYGLAAGIYLYGAGGSEATTSAGGNETRPKNVYVNYIIKY